MQKEIRWLLEEKYRGNMTAAAKRDIARLKRGEHMDYVIGFVEFAGCVINLSFKPFIPRPETEYWILQAIKALRIKPGLKRMRCLDIFAGSGCIGIAVLKHIPTAHVDFAEKEKRFLKQIHVNAKLNNIHKRRYRAFQSDVFSNISGKYDCIFANPPYIPESKNERVQKSVLSNEPKRSIFGGKDGLSYIRRFLGKAKEHLYPGGKIYMEFDSPQKKEIDGLLKRFGYQSWQFHKDQYGKDRLVVVEN